MCSVLDSLLPVHVQGFQVVVNLYQYQKRPCRGGGGGGGGWSHVACLNFKTSRVGVYKCLSIIVGFTVTVAIWVREVVTCCDFILHAVATFWAMSLVGIYPGRASL